MKIQKLKVSRIVSCTDGDTFRIAVDTWPAFFGQSIPVRVRGVNCPELRSRYLPIRTAAIGAKNFTNELLFNASEVVLLNVQRGKYFRLVADVQIDGRDLKSLLINAGHGVPTFKFV